MNSTAKFIDGIEGEYDRRADGTQDVETDLTEWGAANQLVPVQTERGLNGLALTSGMASTAPPLPTRLDGLISRANEWDSEFTEIGFDAAGLRFEPAGIIYCGQLISMDQACRTRLFTKIGAPGRYLEQHSPVLQATLLTEHAMRGDFGQRPTVVMNRNSFVTIAQGELRSLPIADVISAAQDGLGNDADGLVVTRIAGYPGRLDVEIVSPSKAIAVRPGDIVQSGLHIDHQRFGNRATLIESFTYRLVCTNGMTRRQCSGEGCARTRRLPVNLPNSSELQLAQIRRLVRRNWDGLQEQLDVLRATAERPARVRELLSQWLRNVRVSPVTMLERLLTAWNVEGAENTFYGAVNALTRVATHDRELSERQRRVLGSLAGVLAFSAKHVCDRCFSVISRAVEEHVAI